MSEYKLARSPRLVAIIAYCLTIAIGAVTGVIAMAALPADHHEARVDALISGVGRLSAIVAMVVAAVAYLVQRRRTRS